MLFNHSTHTIDTRQPGVRSPCLHGLATQELEAELGAVCGFLEGASRSTHDLGAVATDQAVARLKAPIRAALAGPARRSVDRLVSLKRQFAFKVRV